MNPVNTNLQWWRLVLVSLLVGSLLLAGCGTSLEGGLSVNLGSGGEGGEGSSLSQNSLLIILVIFLLVVALVAILR